MEPNSCFRQLLILKAFSSQPTQQCCAAVGLAVSDRFNTSFNTSESTFDTVSLFQNPFRSIDVVSPLDLLQPGSNSRAWEQPATSFLNLA